MSYFSQLQQNVLVDPNNTTSDNLAGGATYTGAAASTLGVAGIQVSLKTDQNCIVYVDQSPDGISWDLTDEYEYLTGVNNFGLTVQAINSYVRVRVTNTSSTITTYLRLQTVLCPIVEPLPRSLDTYGNLKVGLQSISDKYGFVVENTPMGEMRTTTPIKIVGSNFEGTTINTNFWTVTNANGGTTTQANSQIVLSTNTTLNGSTKFHSVRRARYNAGSAQAFRTQLRLGDTGAVGNKRRWGIAWGTTMPTITDGAYFQIDGTTFSVCTLRGGVETKVDSGSFNGRFGTTYELDTNVRVYEIYWTNGKVYFVIGDDILHTVSANVATWASTMNHHIFLDNVNTAILTNHYMECRVASIRRLGSITSQPLGKYQSGTTAGVVCKHGPGNIHGIIISGAANNSNITLYDNIAASGTVLWSSGPMGALSTPFELSLYNLPFSTGLTLVIGTATANVLLIYE